MLSAARDSSPTQTTRSGSCNSPQTRQLIEFFDPDAKKPTESGGLFHIDITVKRA